MPIYEYRCSNCGHELEALQKLADAPLVVCPSCNAQSLVKLVSASAFQLKGSGWYATDFKGGAKPAAKPDERREARRRRRRPNRSPEVEDRIDEPKRRPSEARSEDRNEARQEDRVRHALAAEPAAPLPRRARRHRPSAMKRYIIAGLLVWVPLGITIWVLSALVSTLDQSLRLLPESAQPDRLLGVHIPGFGVLLSFVILLVTGAIAANFAGARLIQAWESLLARIPFVKSIYSSVKQVSDTRAVGPGHRVPQGAAGRVPAAGLLDDRVPDRQRRRAKWRATFPASTSASTFRRHPNPTGGYFIMVPKASVHELDITVDEALKYIISMGSWRRAHAPDRAAPRALPADVPSVAETRN